MKPDQRYTDWKEIGRGGFGAVYRVFDQVLKRQVAIKLLKKELVVHTHLVEALHREVLISRDLRHENICPIHDVYEGPQGVGTVMDLIDGVELGHWMAENQNRLLDTADQRLVLLKKLVDALAFAHSHIVHRDLKPDNVFLLGGDPARPVIMDFGAAVVGKGGDGAIAGTPRYMSPEQWEAPDLVDSRSDLFALGILAYELFTGKTPPTSLRQILKTKQPPKIPQAEITPPSRFCLAVPDSLDRIIIQLMAYRQEDRPHSAKDVARALDAVTLLSPDVANRGVGGQVAELVNQMITLPGGHFYLGSNVQAHSHERPAKKIFLSPFRMGLHPVTVREYRAFIESTGYSPPPLLDDPVFGQPDHPVVGVSYENALAFAHWMGGDLPTEAQWEYAAKGGSPFPAYPWGDDPPSPMLANIDNVSQSTSSVQSCPAGRNPFGFVDLCGNVWEWCKDYWDPGFYKTLKADMENPINDRHDSCRVLRGGGFDSFASQGRCSARFYAKAEERGRSIGFRVVLPA